MQRTLSIIKPDAVAKNLIGKIISRLEAGGLQLVHVRMEFLSNKRVKEFYREHQERPFFSSLVEFMSSGPVLLMVLKGPDAIARNREIMGATDPAEAAAGTIRADFAASVEQNAVHGSDSIASAEREISFFFSAA